MRKLPTLLFALFLVLAACSPGDSDETTTTASEGTIAESTGTTESAPTTSEPAPTTTTEPQSSAGASCLEGTWALDIQSFISFMQDAFTSEGFGADSITANDGPYLVTFGGDGTFTTEREDWGFTVVTSDGTFKLSINGSETGTWTADDSTITVTVTSSDVTASSTAEVDGQTIQIPESPVEVPDAIAEESAYTCAGDVLMVTTEDVVITLNRA